MKIRGKFYFYFSSITVLGGTRTIIAEYPQLYSQQHFKAHKTPATKFKQKTRPAKARSSFHGLVRSRNYGQSRKL